VDDIHAGKLTEEDRYLHSEHPLVTLVEGTLEAITRNNLKHQIVGFSERSESQLREERRALERSKRRPKFQQLLYCFEEICRLIRESGYGSEDGDASDDFFESLFPTWLESLQDWASEDRLAGLEHRMSQAIDMYEVPTW
jgi:hypothetical protein